MKTIEISKNKQPVKFDVHDPNFNKPISHLTKTYSGSVTLITKIKPK